MTKDDVQPDVDDQKQKDKKHKRSSKHESSKGSKKVRGW